MGVYGVLVHLGRTNMPDKCTPDRGREKSRKEQLAEIAGLPSSAFIRPAHAAAYIGSTPGVMLNWRAQRRGPRYHGKNGFIRYRISDLDLWMASRANEVPHDKPLTSIDPGRAS
jgi:hypothetical protein